MKFAAIAVATLLFAALPCRAEDPAPPQPAQSQSGQSESAPPVAAAPVTDWADIETVVVTASSGGPAFWHIRKGDSEIYILGTVSPMPEGMTWNSAHFAEIMHGARALYTAPTASSGFFETSWFLLTHRGLLSMPDNQKLEDTLPADLRTRFVAARSALKIDADEYEDDPPVLTAMQLQQAYNKAHRLENKEPWETVKRIAKENRVPVRPVGEYGALGLIKEMLRLPPEAQRECLREAVAYTEFSTAHNQALAEAWASGNVGAIKANYYPAGFGSCIKQAASFGKLNDRAVADYLKVIRESLAQPGKAVLLTDIGSLLRQTGVAEVLQKEGITIEGPAE